MMLGIGDAAPGGAITGGATGISNAGSTSGGSVVGSSVGGNTAGVVGSPGSVAVSPVDWTFLPGYYGGSRNYNILAPGSSSAFGGGYQTPASSPPSPPPGMYPADTTCPDGWIILPDGTCGYLPGVVGGNTAGIVGTPVVAGVDQGGSPIIAIRPPGNTSILGPNGSPIGGPSGIMTTAVGGNTAGVVGTPAVVGVDQGGNPIIAIRPPGDTSILGPTGPPIGGPSGIMTTAPPAGAMTGGATGAPSNPPPGAYPASTIGPSGIQTTGTSPLGFGDGLSAWMNPANAIGSISSVLQSGTAFSSQLGYTLGLIAPPAVLALFLLGRKR